MIKNVHISYIPITFSVNSQCSHSSLCSLCSHCSLCSLSSLFPVYNFVYMLSSPKDRCSPEMIVIMQESNMARVRWFFPDTISRDISYFRVSVKKDHCDDEILSKNVATVDQSCTVGDILPRIGYTVTVETIYNDGISRKRYVRYNDFGKSIDTRTAFSALNNIAHYYCVMANIQCM